MVASEPVFSVAPCVQVPAAVVPNGSSSAGATQAKGGKVTAEQLAAVEDEDLLDKMVLHLAAEIYQPVATLFPKPKPPPLNSHRQFVLLAVNLGANGGVCLSAVLCCIKSLLN